MVFSKKYLLIVLFIFASDVAFSAVKNPAAVPNEKQSLIEELTGKKVSAKAGQPAQPAVVSPARRHLNSGYQAFVNKDYIQALKHYNAIALKYPQSKSEVRLSYLAKAKLYQEMGLQDVAQRNLRLAQQISATEAKK